MERAGSFVELPLRDRREIANFGYIMLPPDHRPLAPRHSRYSFHKTTIVLYTCPVLALPTFTFDNDNLTLHLYLTM